MATWITLLLALLRLAGGEPSVGGEVTPGAPSFHALSNTRFEDSLGLFAEWQDKLCVENTTVPNTQCTVMRGGKVYVVNKTDITALKEHGLALLSKHYPKTFFLSRPLVFCCCCHEFMVAGITNNTISEEAKDERVQRALSDWKERYEALKGHTLYYGNFMKHQSIRVDAASQMAMAMIKKAKANAGKEGNNDLSEFITKVDEIRFNELGERLNKAERVRAKRSDVW